MTDTPKLDRWLLAILLIGLVLRLHKLDAPIMDADSFRQGATASIARNYYEHGYPLFEPRITGWGGLREPALWPNEFPLYPYAVSLLYRIFGEQLWLGRLVTLAFGLAGAVALFQMVRRYEGLAAARFAALWFTLSPQAIYHHRCFHRHPIAIALMLFALAAFSRWLDTGCKKAWAAMTGCAAVTLLLMPPLVTCVVPALYLYHTVKKRWFWRDAWLWAALVLMMLPPLLWYGWAVQQPGSWSLGSWGREHFRNWTSPGYYLLWWEYDLFRTVWGNLWRYTLGPPALFLGVAGVFYQSGRTGNLLAVWTLTVLAYYVFDVAPIAVETHHIYFLMISPPLCWGAARTTALLWNAFEGRRALGRIALGHVLIAAIVLGNIHHWSQTLRPWYIQNEPLLRAAELIRKNTPEDAALLVDTFNPCFLYYTERMGAAQDPPGISLESVRRWEAEGADYLAIVNPKLFFPKMDLREYLKATAETVIANDELRLYKLGGVGGNGE